MKETKCNKCGFYKERVEFAQNIIKSLEQQLADKDEEIKQLKEQRHIYLNRSVDECNKITMLELELQHKNQDKISFAVEKLEKVKDFISNTDIKKLTGYLDSNSAQTQAISITNYIDNQIKQLKEEANENNA